MKNRPTLLRMPDYLTDFKCLGPDCEDHCCYGWDIFVDKATWLRYRKVKTAPLANLLENAIRRNRENPSDARYAKILRDGVNCPFLTRARRCRIHAELGEALLPDVCAVFPRRLRARESRIEISASLACPEIARRALTHPGGIAMVQTPLDARTSGALRAVEPRLPLESESMGLRLQRLALALLQNRHDPVWHRLLQLGFLFDSVSRAETPAIPAMLDAFATQTAGKARAQTIEDAPVLNGLQFQIVYRLHSEIIAAVRVQAFRELTASAFTALGCSQALAFDKALANRYDQAFEAFYAPFFERHGHLLENYLVSVLHHHDIGFSQGRHLYEDYVTLVLHFAMLKTYLIGIAAFYGRDLTPAVVVRLICAFTKVLEPDARFRQFALDLLDQSHCTDLLSLAVMVKN